LSIARSFVVVVYEVLSVSTAACVNGIRQSNATIVGRSIGHRNRSIINLGDILLAHLVALIFPFWLVVLTN